MGYKCNYGPLLSDLYSFIPHHDIDYLERKATNPVLPETQLAYVLPKTSHYLLNTGVQDVLNRKYNYYYINNKFQWAFCKFFWESKLTFKYVNINELENDIKHITILIYNYV